jgi:endoglucanase
MNIMDKRSLQVGINLGGWISQYPAYDHQYFKTFLIRDDIQRIADWGMDHVRLPVDYPLLEDDDQPGVYKESGFEYIESCLEWCRRNGLYIILDLHKAPGFAFDALDQASLFASPARQQRFIDLWSAIARRFVGRLEDALAFELLNEIVLPDSRPWNELVRRTIAQIRTIDPARLILVGGNYYNSADELQNLEVIADSNVFYTFHYYLPLTVTHQRAPWIAPLAEYDHALDYPGQQAVGLEAILKNYPSGIFRLDREVGVCFDQDHLHALLQPALDFSERIHQPLYCGEFGVIERAPMSTRLNWTRDFIGLLNQFGIGHAYWTYKALDFGLVDENGKVVNQELIKVVAQRAG